MAALPLDDQRWAQLWSSDGPARNMPDLISYLLEHPDKADAIGNLQLAACSDGTTWSGGFAALPYLVEIARKLPPAQRLDVLTAIGWIVIGTTPEPEDPHARLEPYLEEAFTQAIRDSVPLAAESLQSDLDERDMAGVFFVIAALKGHIPLAGVLANLDSCEHCNEILGWS
jgi:hypothetical protein